MMITLSLVGSGLFALAGFVSAPLQGADTIPVPDAVRVAYEQRTRSPDGAPGERYWQMWPEYDLEGRLDPEQATVHGSGRVAFVNRSPETLHEIVLRLDQNRFRSRLQDGGSTPVTTRGIEIRQLSIDSERIDLAGPAITGLATTVVRIRLTHPLPPGRSLALRFTWDYEVPLDEQGEALRGGRWGTELFQMGQWYPRIAMYDDLGGWDAAPHDGSVEFYNPFASFRVKLQVPSGWLVGATGTLTNREDVLGPTALERLAVAEASDTTLAVIGVTERGSDLLAPATGSQTWTFAADSVSDFAWGASASYAWTVSSRTMPGRRVLVHALMTPRHRDALAAASEAANAIAILSTLVMPYPWASHTLVDGPEGGMEYPGLTMSNGNMIAHELAHQWFPMMVGSDETRFNFLDEGFANYYAAVVSGSPVARKNVERPALQALLPANDLRTPRTALGYGRGSRMLHALAARVGEERMLAALRSYALEWRFKHPSPWDFMASMERFLGDELDPFWMQWLFRSEGIRP